jgi:hypothetical protein
VKTFFLRELAFLAAPLFLLTRFKDLKAQALAVLFSVLLFVTLSKTLSAFVLYPVDWEAWVGVVLGAVVSTFLAFFAMFLLV